LDKEQSFFLPVATTPLSLSAVCHLNNKLGTRRNMYANTISREIEQRWHFQYSKYAKALASSANFIGFSSVDIGLYVRQS
jgi:hypothetical protein